MNPEYIRGNETEQKTDRRREVIEMHLFDDAEAEEKALCDADTSDDTLRSAMYYLEDRLHGARVGVVCAMCKFLAIPSALKVAQDPGAEGLPGEAEEYRQLAETLMAETGIWNNGPLVRV